MQRGSKNRQIIASRDFLFKGTKVTIKLLEPKKEGKYYRCEFRVLGMPIPDGLSCSREETRFGAIASAYYSMFVSLTRLKGSLKWVLAPEGQLGLPVCVLTAHDYGEGWLEELDSLVDEKLLR